MTSGTSIKLFIGEILGTFILVFVGCGSIALALVYESLSSLWQIALCWGGAVTFSILVLHRWGPVHLNPAVSLFFFLRKQVNIKHLGILVVAQSIGAAVATLALYGLISTDLENYELMQQISRNNPSGINSAMIFTEFFPNPGEGIQILSGTSAFMAEWTGTGLLILVVALLSKYKIKVLPSALLIGLALSILIFFIAPYTQAGFNPARDFIPRIIILFLGWDQTVWANGFIGAILTYVLAPALAATCLSLVFSTSPKKTL